MRWILCLFLVLFSLPALAGTVYQWTDSSGVTHFSTEPPESGVEARKRDMGTGGRAGTPSQRVRDIRCRDFRGALDQLRELRDTAEGNPQWLSAKEYASEKSRQWCEE